MKKAFIEIQYNDDGPSFAGFCINMIASATVIEVEIEDNLNEYEAELSARKKFRDKDIHGMTVITGSRFLRWI